MHTCPDCGKAMATIGGLEIHMQMQHAAPAPEPEPEPVPEPVAIAEPEPARRPWPARSPSPVLGKYDPTVPLTALLVLALLVAGIGAAVHRSTTTPSHLASISSDAPAPDGATTQTTVVPVPARAPASSAPSPGGSPAAIPPAGSQPPATAQASTTPSECTSLVDSLSKRNSKRTVDIAQLVRTNTFPALPLPGFDHPAVADLGHWGTAKEYVDTLDPSDPDTARWQELLIQNGFVSADDIEFVNGASSYGVAVFQFTTSANARAFNRGTLLAACSEGILENPRAMPALSGGVNYLIAEGPPFRASFVAGDSVVRLHICHCVQAPDDQVLAGQWAQAVASGVGAG